MSGHKRASLKTNLENIRAFSQTEMSLRFVESGLDQLTRRLDKLADQARNKDLAREQQKRDRWLQDISSVDTQISQFESGIEAMLADQHNDLIEFVRLIEHSWDHDQTIRLDALHNDFQSKFDELNAWIADNFDSLIMDMDCLVATQNRKHAYFQRWLTAIDQIQQEIAREPEIDLFFPRILEHSTQNVNLALENAKEGFLDTGLMGLQQTYQWLSKKRMKYKLFQQQYMEVFRTAKSNLEKVEAELRNNRTVPGIDLEGNLLSINIVVDDWVYGALSDLQRKIDAAKMDLEKPATQESLAELKTIVAMKIPAWHTEIGDIVARARVEVINSQLRVNIAMMAKEVLLSLGYKLDDAYYQGEDLRNQFIFHMIDHEGSRITVNVCSNPDQPSLLDLDIFTQDVIKRPPHEIARRSLEIQRSLSKMGIDIRTLDPASQTTTERDGYKQHQEGKLHINQEIHI